MPAWDTILVPMLLRWLHFFFGIAWIGHLYYFNFVQGAFEKGLDAAAKKYVVPANRGRAFWWFRWGAMITMLTGVTYIGWEQSVASHQNFAGFFDAANTKNYWITMGMALAFIMWFNVWMVIWPRQKQIIAGIATGNKPADFDALVARAGAASRLNTYLSVPMLFGMGARSHFPTGEVGPTLGWIGGVVVVGFIIGYLLVNKFAPTVGTEFVKMLPPAPAAPAPAAPSK